MKKISLASVLLASMLLVSIPAVAEMKIGFVNTVKLMEMAPQAKASASKIETEFAPRDKELMDMQRSIREKEDKLARDGAIMKEDQQSRLERDVRAEQRDLKRVREEFREDLTIRRNEELAKLQRSLSTAIENVGKKQSFDIILMETSVVFVSDRIDLTGEVLKELKQEHEKTSK